MRWKESWSHRVQPEIVEPRKLRLSESTHIEILCWSLTKFRFWVNEDTSTQKSYVFAAIRDQFTIYEVGWDIHNCVGDTGISLVDFS